MRVILLFVYLLLTSCISVQVYKEPVSGDTAKIMIPNLKTEYALLGGFKSGAVMVSFKEKNGCGSLNKIPAQGTSEKFITVDVPVDKEVMFLVTYSFGNNFCSVGARFQPKTENTYELKFGMGSKQCGLSMKDVTNTESSKPIELEGAMIPRGESRACAVHKSMMY